MYLPVIMVAGNDLSYVWRQMQFLYFKYKQLALQFKYAVYLTIVY